MNHIQKVLKFFESHKRKKSVQSNSLSHFRKKGVQFFESYKKKGVRFFESYSKKFNSLSMFKKKKIKFIEQYERVQFFESYFKMGSIL